MIHIHDHKWHLYRMLQMVVSCLLGLAFSITEIFKLKKNSNKLIAVLGDDLQDH
jgi:hypothetical protein